MTNVVGARDRATRVSPVDVDRAVKDGALLTDVRGTDEFVAGHLPHAINVPSGTSFADRLRSVAGAERPIILLVGSDETLAGVALRDASLAGRHNVIGWAGQDVTEVWIAGGRSLSTTKQVDPDNVNNSDRLIVDVREASERNDGTIPSARHIPLADLMNALANVPKDQPLAMHCKENTRGVIAASLLEANGFTDVANLKGGLNGWRAAGLRVDGSEGE